MTDPLVKFEGATPLSIAVRRGFVAITKFLVDAGADVVAKDDKGYTAVDSAVEMDNAELVKALLKRGRPDPRDSAWDGSVQKALMAAAMRDNKDLVDLLIAFPVIGENGTTSLIRAAVNRLVGLVSRLVAQGENVDARDANGNTALHHVVLHGDAGTASALLEMGADPNSIGQNGWTPLIAACVEGHETFVELLLTRGASINYREPNYGLTALHYAVSRGRTHIIERLVRSGASVHPSEACQSTPLLLACSMSNAAAVYATINTLKLMGEISTVTEIVNAAGPGRWTPVNTSASNGNLELVKFLVANGASLTTKNDKGFSRCTMLSSTAKSMLLSFSWTRRLRLRRKIAKARHQYTRPQAEVSSRLRRCCWTLAPTFTTMTMTEPAYCMPLYLKDTWIWLSCWSNAARI